MAINVFVKSGGSTLEEITATVDKVVSGYTYNDSEGEVKTGTMINKGDVIKSIGVGETYTNTSGYYSSITINGPILPTQTPSNTIVPNGGIVTGEAGYYDAFTIKAKYAVERVELGVRDRLINSSIVAEGYWGASTNAVAKDFKIVSSGGYIWYSLNGSSSSRLYLTRVYEY